jgi:hypothetical protein
MKSEKIVPCSIAHTYTMMRSEEIKTGFLFATKKVNLLKAGTSTVTASAV